MEPNSPKKIQFAVPLFQSQIDPEAAEQIRKRRPTPASLVIMTDSPPEIDEKRMNNNSQEESQNATPKQRKQSVYTPPAMKGTVQISFLSPPSQPSHVIGSRVKSRQSGQRI
ncbi:protein phosphatase 1 regulatory subunit 1C isoform X1 [Hemicordylus capensis]|uniref:protein phosphatase 1 regulatory subunit 1C isoform X1 n=1 Tax=Hemicordylus capensis TaxID=884348 RepID=UPI002302E051|nr:protein phosphatase 1 regulatory subunit 1C isoform X1 [Hemicordylus capensis]XP_053125891.1 protein phosphatase 1 regulatory subunit 1C isoform X1 [Hemicordylus capensis]